MVLLSVTRVDGSYDSREGWQDTSVVCFRTCHSTKFQSGSFHSKPLTDNFALCQEHNSHFSFVLPYWQRPRKRAGISGNSTLKLRDNAKVWRSAHVAEKTVCPTVFFGIKPRIITVWQEMVCLQQQMTVQCFVSHKGFRQKVSKVKVCRDSPVFVTSHLAFIHNSNYSTKNVPMQLQHYYYDSELVIGQPGDADWLSMMRHEGKFNTHKPVPARDAALELPPH